MVKKNNVVVSLLQTLMEDLEINNNITQLQCLIHQKVLYAKVSSLKSVMNIVVKVVNFIWLDGYTIVNFTNYFYKQRICIKTCFISAISVGLA